MAKHEFPAFSKEYGDRFREMGLWIDETLHGHFDEKVEEHADVVILITPERKFTMHEFQQETLSLAAGLLNAGVSQGDIVGVQLPNWIEFCCLQIALSRIGAVIQPLHMVFGERELKNLCAFNETDAVIVCGEYRDKDYAAQMRGAVSENEGVKTFIVVRSEPEAGEYLLQDLIEEGRSNHDRLDGIQINPDDVFYLNFTSGTTGNPKGFLHSHNTLISRMILTAKMQSAMSDGEHRVSLACSPMTHSYGHFSTYGCVFGPSPMVLVDRYNPTQILEFIQADKVTSLSGTPAHMMGIIDHVDFEKYDTSSIKSVGVGGARSSPELIDRLDKLWGVKTGNTYGMGENLVHCMTFPNDPEDKIKDTVGRPVPWVELKIVDTKDRSRVCETGEIGEICFRGPTLFVGYNKQPEKTAETRDSDGWFFTGDLGQVDEEGYLSFAGREQEVINRGGSKIYPKEVEDLLGSHPNIREAAVVGMPDERMGEKVCAYVIPQEGVEITLDDVKEYFMELKAMKYLIPEALINLEAFPMTPTGKVRKASLQDDARKMVEQQNQAD
ncbi:MAG: AMP-binding protein [Gammaproteobacteria bacterium]|jgi:non-ribosomal peptide synthetase component E (peptide arylation enzyme)|nr:AMP-binding protein [Gammaproteobacteria bacterium]MBT4493359.1 AMP-binding protein [Gammaproteobacteria bacterium]